MGVPLKERYDMADDKKGLRELTLDDLNRAAKLGGPSTLTERTLLEPAAGVDGIVAPAKYAKKVGRNSVPVYVFEDRFMPLDKDERVTASGKPTDDGQVKVKRVVLVDSRTSQNNRAEAYIAQAIENKHSVFSRMPRMRVTYTPKGEPEHVAYDVTLPQRAFDGHFRIGTIDGKSVSKNPVYIGARNATLANLAPLFELSPITVAFGGWDSTRRNNQLRLASPYNGEIIGVVAQQSEDASVLRAGARIDPVAAGIRFDKKQAESILENIGKDLSDSTDEAFEGDGKGSRIGVGAIPPTIDSLDGIAVSDIVRTHVLSFSILRTLHFGRGAEGDQAIRVLIAAMILDAMAGSNGELKLRANCMLRESSAPVTVLDERYGEFTELAPLSVDRADALLEEAYEQAHAKAGVDWHGQIFDVTGNPLVTKVASAEEPQE